MKHSLWIPALAALLLNAASVGATTISLVSSQVHIAGDWLNGTYSDYAPSFAADSGGFTNPFTGGTVEATSVADLSKGHLGAFASSYTSAARAWADFDISFDVVGAMSSPGLVVMTMHGTLGGLPDDGINDDAEAFLDVNGQLDALFCTELGGCPQRVMSFFFNGGVHIHASLFVEGRNADFLHSADVSVFLPADVIIKDGTGFLHAADPVASPVPEPASLLLVASGLAGSGARRWRKRRQAA